MMVMIVIATHVLYGIFRDVGTKSFGMVDSSYSDESGGLLRQKVATPQPVLALPPSARKSRHSLLEHLPSYTSKL